MTDGAEPDGPGMAEIDADAVDSLATAADLLYAAPAETFVPARDHLVKALRARGRRDLATEVKTLRRPTVIAAELNQVLRASPADRDALLEAAQALAEGQRRLLAGEVTDLAGLQSAHRAAVSALADRAVRHQGEIHAALEAASIDEALHAQLHSATFAQEPTPTRGFDLLAAAGLTASGPRPERPARPTATGPAGRRRLPDRRAAGADPSRTGPVPSADPDPADPAPSVDPGPAHTDAAGSDGEGGPATPAAAPLTAAPPMAQPPRLRSVPSPPTARELELAERRLEAAQAGEGKAAQRLADAEARLDEARRHHADTIRRREAAETALARLRAADSGPA